MNAAVSSVEETRQRLLEGMVIPAHPLALTGEGRFDVRHQRALTRYYHAAGAGGVAVGVHTTQFAIRDAEHGLLEPVLELAAETVSACDRAAGTRTVRVAGICGRTEQAVREATLASRLGYDAGLVSFSAWRDADDDALIRHAEEVAEAIPVFGFYLQPSVGGRVLTLSFWRRFVAIAKVVAIKVAPFDRYRTLDVLRAVAESGRAGEIALYTGNDDTIGADLLTGYEIGTDAGRVRLAFAGGLLGHWACWTRQAVAFWRACREARQAGAVPADLLRLSARVTEANAALFDAANGYAGCIAGIHQVLSGQGLMAGTRCLDPKETLSAGQAEEIERIRRLYPELPDDAFVAAQRDKWLAD
ncbi:MAG: dihydrodipicolinate synthase family protein [Verrucomicrobiae bacterium]|nr:dihydrodipicolinate synthase family protein [Verrucomicrobiae bacterium]